jgi:hypothetical protein
MNAAQSGLVDCRSFWQSINPFIQHPAGFFTPASPDQCPTTAQKIDFSCKKMDPAVTISIEYGLI